MANDASSILSLAVYGYQKRPVTFEFQLVREKKVRDRFFVDGVKREDLPPFTPGLVAAAVNETMLQKAGIDTSSEKIQKFLKWEYAASNNYYGTEDPERKQRYLSNFIESVYVNSDWWNGVMAKYEKADSLQKGEAYSRYIFADPTARGLLMDFAWYYENLRTGADSHIQKSIVNFQQQHYPVKLAEKYPAMLLSRFNAPDLISLGATEDEIKQFFNSDFSSSLKVTNAVEKIMLPLCERNGIDLAENYDEKGVLIPSPIFREDGTADYWAAMKHFRHVKQQNAKAMGFLSRTGIRNVDEAKNRGYVSSTFKMAELDDDFMTLALASGDESTRFLKTIGLSDESMKRIAHASDLWNSNRADRKNMARGVVLSAIGGRQTREDKEGLPSVISSIVFSFEFAIHATETERFLDEFKRQNQIRKNSGWKAPFSDDFLIRCRDENWLRTLGMPENNIASLMRFRMDINNLTPEARKNFSNLLGGNNGLRASAAYRDAQGAKSVYNYKATVDGTSSLPEIYRALRTESGCCFQVCNRQSEKEKFSYVYSDELLEALFRTDILEEVRRTYEGGSYRLITKKWIEALSENSEDPENCVIICKNTLAQDGVEGAVTKNMLLESLQKENGSESTPGDFVAKIFSMLAMSGYSKGDNSYWMRLNEGQRATFSQTMNIDMVKLFKNWAAKDPANAASLNLRGAGDSN